MAAKAQSAPAGRSSSGKFQRALQIGAYVAVILAVFTVAEYFFATHVSDDTVRVVGLFIVAIIKAYLIIFYFMHLKRAFREEAH
ncbi:MAG: cytochrome C oxidase subunit IV family protein [Dehalococcoidia bacterium]